MKHKIISKAASLLLSAAFLCSSGQPVFAAVKEQKNRPSAFAEDTRISGYGYSSADTLSSDRKTAFNISISDPTDADLDYSKDFGDPERIKEIADKLGNAVDIYNFVRNSIQNEMYKGYKKNPVLTLAQMGGNDMDQAALLVALLRAKNIPARFIRSNIELTSRQALDLSGASDFNTAKEILTNSYPGVVEYSHTINGVTNKSIAVIGHTWVEAYIPYTDYRGAGRRAGEGVWIQLDPSFKKMVPVKTEIVTEFNADQKEMLASLQKLSGDTPDLSAEDFKAPEKAEYTTFRIEQRNEPYLPSSLPYEFFENSNHKWKVEQFSAIKSADKQSVALKINDSTALKELPVAELEGNFIGIGYEPANESSGKILEQTEDISKIDPSKVSLVPVITIGDKKYKSTQKCTLGEIQKLQIIIKNDTVPGKIVGQSEILNRDLIGGSVYAINVDLESISPVEGEIAERAYKEAIDDHETKQAISSDVFGKIAGYAGKEYFTFCDYKNQIHKGIDNVRSNRHLGIAVTGYELSVEYSSGSQYAGIGSIGPTIPDYDYDSEYDYPDNSMKASSVDYGKFTIDVMYDEVTTISLTGDENAARYYNYATGMEASKFEGEIWADITHTDQPCISTVSVMDAAAEKGIDPVYINSSNLSELQKYNLDEKTVKGVTSFVNKGRFIILIPEMMKIGDWEGTAYIATDLKTGTANFMISGGLAGGDSPKMPKNQWDKLWTLNYTLSKITQEVGLFSMASSCIDLGPATQSREYDEILKGIQKFGAATIVYNSGVKMEFAMYEWLDDYLANPGSGETMTKLAETTVNNLRTTEFALLGLYSKVPLAGEVIQVLTTLNTVSDLQASIASGDDVLYNVFVTLWDLLGYL